MCAKKPGRSCVVRQVPERAWRMISSPRMSTLRAKSAAVVTGEKRLHSIAKPRMAMRGEAGGMSVRQGSEGPADGPEVTGDPVVGLHLLQFRRFNPAALPHIGAARVEMATRRR